MAQTPKTILHEEDLHTVGEALNQLTFMGAHSETLISQLNVKMEMTYLSAPRRKSDYKLIRKLKRNPVQREDKLEWSIWNTWNTEDAKSGFVDECRFIQTYQMPLRRTNGDESWGSIDLIGVSSGFLPVVLELKRGGSEETPLRMIIEALAYAIAVRKSWNEGNLRDEWIAAVSGAEGVARTLLEVPIIGIAPKPYWNTKIGARNKRTAGKVPDDAWKPFGKLCQMIGDRGYPVSFWQFEVEEERDDLIGVDRWSQVKVPS